MRHGWKFGLQNLSRKFPEETGKAEKRPEVDNRTRYRHNMKHKNTTLRCSAKGRLRRWLSSGMLQCVVCYKFTDVSEVLTASIIRVMIALMMEALNTSETYDHLDNRGSKHLWNVSKLLPDYTAQHPRRQSSSYSPLWEPEISQKEDYFGRDNFHHIILLFFH
jgi:hypothetical protein